VQKFWNEFDFWSLKQALISFSNIYFKIVFKRIIFTSFSNLKLNCHALDQQDNKNTHKLCTDNKKEISLCHPSYTPRKRRQLLPRRNQNTYQICIAHIKNQLNIYTHTKWRRPRALKNDGPSNNNAGSEFNKGSGHCNVIEAAPNIQGRNEIKNLFQLSCCCLPGQKTLFR